MLEIDDLQYFLLTRPPAPAGRLEWLTFERPENGRAWIAGILEKVSTEQAVQSATESDRTWHTLALTWNGLRALGLSGASLASFPEAFRTGMPRRAQILSDTGDNHPDHWESTFSGDDLHAMLLMSSRDAAARAAAVDEHRALLAATPGVTVSSTLDLDPVPPLDYVHDHFGYRDRLSILAVEGTGVQPNPGSPPPVKAGEFFLGYPDETGNLPETPEPDVLARNGSYLAFRKLRENVGAFRDFLAKNAATPADQELLAAKLMGRWRSGAPLVLAPNKDDPALGGDLQRTNDFDYGKMDPHGYACPLGAHIRRMNPRDTSPVDIRRRHIVRRGATYGPALAEGAPDDGVDRGVAVFAGCASLVRQFEFLQSVWANDPRFQGLDNERDPIIGDQDGTFDMTIPKRPIRKRIKGLPAFTTVRGGAYLFLPGIGALRLLAGQSGG